MKMVNTRIPYNDEEESALQNCSICPRKCGVNRFEGGPGYCGMDAGLNISAVCLHRGEEPLISGPEGICNVFFAGCNMRCIYCQNHEISRKGAASHPEYRDLDKVADDICSLLSGDVISLGFVSPSHQVMQLIALVREIRRKGFNPVTVYNTNCYDNPDTIDMLSGIIDVYLPDLKYVSAELSGKFSDTPWYPEVSLEALKRMYYHVGSPVLKDEKGRALRGLIIRHLVLPGYTDESKKVLRTIADELSPGVHVSLMSQYYPAHLAKDHSNLGNSLYEKEYMEVVEEMSRLGFRNGYVQDPGSSDNYRPDFSKKYPFGHD